MVQFIKNFLAKKAGKKEYGEKLMHFLSDNKLDASEKNELETIIKKSGLKKEELMEYYSRACSVVNNNISSDQRITETEKNELNQIAKYFDINADQFNFDQDTFNKFSALALIDKGILPDLKDTGLDIVLKKDEVIHWICPAQLRKLKKVTKRVNYSGFTHSIKIVGGLRYRVGSIKVGTETSEFFITEDNGNLWITNKRVGFRGQRKSFALPYEKIHYFELNEASGLVISKEGKETPYTFALLDYDVPCSIISSIMNCEK